MLEKLSRYAITKERLEVGRQLISTAEEANAKQEKEKGDAQQAARLRDEAMDDLYSWLSEFAVICKYALASKPEYVEKLGFLERS